MARAAGSRAGRVTSVDLVTRMARWQPDSTDPHTVDIAAFAEAGGLPSIPGPLIAVDSGGTIALSIRNTFDDTLLLFGFGRRRGIGDGDTLVVAPHETRYHTFAAPPVGTWTYYAKLKRERDVLGPGFHELAGVIRVGPPVPGERMFAIDGRSHVNGNDTAIFWTLNGRMWPATERFAFNVGDSVRWRFVNLSSEEHPMHLHGFYFRLDELNAWTTRGVIPPPQRPLEVTQIVPLGGSFAMTWVPERVGQWLMHCHIASHMSGKQHNVLAGDTTPAEALPMHMDPAMHVARDMGGLILGITVNGPAWVADTSRPAQRLRLVIQRRANQLDGHRTDAYGYALQRAAEPARDSVELPGPALALTRGALAEITVVNHLPVATTVHWHGIELDSYYDGIGGWSGVKSSIAPIIAPGDSFIVRIRPPRAGTFIYHSHLAENPQLNRGLVGPLLVLEPGQRYDARTDHVVLIHVLGNGDSALVLANGKVPADPIHARPGVPQRVRFIMVPADDIGDVSIGGADTASLSTWRPLAKDGAVLPPAIRVPGPARIHMGPGETFDAQFTPGRDPLYLRVRSYNNFSIPVVP